jgi:phosphatidylglycerophosphatase A
MKNFYKLIANGFGSGLLPLAPGTWGSAVACLLVMAPDVGGATRRLSDPDRFDRRLQLALCESGRSFCRNGARPGKVVADEMVGMWLTLVGLPLNLVNIGLGFAVIPVL